jgi:hypothetical protein
MEEQVFSLVTNGLAGAIQIRGTYSDRDIALKRPHPPKLECKLEDRFPAAKSDAKPYAHSTEPVRRPGPFVPASHDQWKTSLRAPGET